MPKKSLLFHFLKNPATTGSIAPSSRFLIRKLIEPINAKDCRCVVELGAGDGCVTRSMIKKLGNNCLVLSFEINNDLIQSMPNKKNLMLINDDAKNLLKYMRKYSIKKIDYVISSLPLASFKKEDSLAILELVHENLREKGMFIQYQYSLLSLKKIKSIFNDVKIDFVPFNIPPAFIYKCTK